MTRTGAEMVDRTMDSMYVRALNPREILDTTADAMRKTTDSNGRYCEAGDRVGHS